MDIVTIIGLVASILTILATIFGAVIGTARYLRQHPDAERDLANVSRVAVSILLQVITILGVLAAAVTLLVAAYYVATQIFDVSLKTPFALIGSILVVLAAVGCVALVRYLRNHPEIYQRFDGVPRRSILAVSALALCVMGITAVALTSPLPQKLGFDASNARSPTNTPYATATPTLATFVAQATQQSADLPYPSLTATAAPNTSASTSCLSVSWTAAGESSRIDCEGSELQMKQLSQHSAGVPAVAFTISTGIYSSVVATFDQLTQGACAGQIVSGEPYETSIVAYSLYVCSDGTWYLYQYSGTTSNSYAPCSGLLSPSYPSQWVFYCPSLLMQGNVGFLLPYTIAVSAADTGHHLTFKYNDKMLATVDVASLAVAYRGIVLQGSPGVDAGTRVKLFSYQN